MNQKMHKHFFLLTWLSIFILLILFLIFPHPSVIFAEACPADNPNCRSLECPPGIVCIPPTPNNQELLPGGCIALPIGLEIGLCPQEQGFSGYLQRMYGFLLAFVGIAAFGGITYGGLLYVFAAGSIGKVDEAKKWIWNALIGLLVTAISFILLSTINPDLVNNVSIDLCKYVPSACSGSTAPPTPNVSCDPNNDQCPSGSACIPSPSGGGVCRTTEVILK